MKQQHQSLLQLAEELLTLISAVQEEQLVEREKFVRVGHEFVQAQYAHMKLEEDQIFAEIDAVLDQDDFPVLRPT
ncbi:MAG: hemerythrin-like domain-containing protein [Parasphingorhabdus sp.]